MRRQIGTLLRRWADRIDPPWFPQGGSDDRIPVKLSDGHGWVSREAMEVFGEDGVKRLLGVDHIHPVGEDE